MGAVLMASLFFVAHPATAATNLVQNGTLETAMVGNAGRPQGWTSSYWGTITGKFTYPVAGKSGGKAAQTQVTKYTSGDAKWYFDYVPVTAGASYQYSQDYSATVATNVTAAYLMKDGTYTYIWLGNPAATKSGAWATFTASTTAPVNAVSVSIMDALQSVGTLTVDNVLVAANASTPIPPPPPAPVAKPVISSFVATPASILIGSSTILSWSVSQASSTSINQNIGAVTGMSKSVSPTSTTEYVLTATNPGGSSYATTTVTVTTPPPPPPTPTTTPTTNLIPNGNLETAMAGNAGRPQGWTSDYWGTMTGKFTYPVAGKNGGKAAQVQVTKYTSGDAKWYFDHVNVSSHTIYTFSDDYNSTVKNNVSVEYLMSDGTYVYDWVADAPATGGAWQTLTAEITVPTGAVSMTVLHTIAAVGTLTIDNASLVANPASPLQSGMLSLTFDDGDLSQYQNALPILTAAGMKASFYIITSEPGSGDSGYMTWVQIKDLASKGFEIGGHTRTHPFLTTLTSAQAQTEISGSFNDLVAQGLTPKTFVYPYGDRSPATDALVKAAGYVGSRGSYYGLDAPFTPRYNLNDIRVDSTTSLAALEAEIQQAIADKRLLVLEIHDVLQSGGDEYAITPAFFQSLVNYIKQSGITVVTLQSALGNIQ